MTPSLITFVHSFELDSFFCRCSLPTVIELQWSNISFILSQESLLELFVSTLRLGITMFQWEWKFMAVKMVYTFFLFLYHSLACSLRKQTTFCDAISGFPAKWRLKNERRNSILMTRRYLDLGTASDWSHCLWNLLQPIRRFLWGPHHETNVESRSRA